MAVRYQSLIKHVRPSTGHVLSKSKINRPRENWCVYILSCANGSYYTGFTNNLNKRISAHNAGRGAKYTAAFGPVKLLWHRGGQTRSVAAKNEAIIKRLNRYEKNLFLIIDKLNN